MSVSCNDAFYIWDPLHIYCHPPGVCSPGSFSDTGLEQCETCSKGSYQPHPGSMDCVPCTDGTSTLKTGSISDTECLGSFFFLTTSELWVVVTPCKQYLRRVLVIVGSEKNRWRESRCFDKYPLIVFRTLCSTPPVKVKALFRLERYDTSLNFGQL